MRRESEAGRLDDPTLDLWLAWPEDLAEAGAREACEALVSAGECAKALRYRFERHQRQFLATRALARTALSRHAGLTPEAWRFPTNEYGKPSIEPECGLRFNLSNSEKLAVCLIARGREVGVDVEPQERAAGIDGVARKAFSAREREQLEALTGAARLERALALWTLKEAYIKALGKGLAIPLGSFSFLFGGAAGIELAAGPEVDEEPGRWRFCLLDHADHRIAVMVECGAGESNPELRMWETRPATVAPRQIGHGAVEWFPRAID